jgi:hypothetical protein
MPVCPISSPSGRGSCMAPEPSVELQRKTAAPSGLYAMVFPSGEKAICNGMAGIENATLPDSIFKNSVLLIRPILFRSLGNGSQPTA